MMSSPLYRALLMALRHAARLQNEAKYRREETEISIHISHEGWKELKTELGSRDFSSMSPGSWLIGVEPVPDKTVEPGTVQVRTRKVYR